MATTVASPPSLLDRLLPNWLLAAVSVALAAAAIIAIGRGAADWGRVPPLVWLHLATVLAATLLTPVMLLRAKGTCTHRRLGRIWVGAMMLTAATTLFFNAGHAGGLGVFSGDISPIHALSLFVLAMAPRLVWLARRHRVAEHQQAVRGMVTGALLVAGWFTFAFDRMLGTWLFG